MYEMHKPIDEALFDSTEVDKEVDGKKKEEITCVICYEELTIPFSLPCKHEAHYNCLMGIQNRLCPFCREPIPKELYKKAQVDIDVLKEADKLLWMYKARSGRGWWFFEPNIDIDIEKAYQEYLLDNRKKEVKYIIRGGSYKIDFSTMKQKSPDNIERDVYRRSADNDRRDLMILGVGGLTSKPL